MSKVALKNLVARKLRARRRLRLSRPGGDPLNSQALSRPGIQLPTVAIGGEGSPA